MNDLQAIRLCAEAIGLSVWESPIRGTIMRHWFMDDHVQREYNPLQYDAQAMALVKQLHLQIGKTLRTPEQPHGEWFVSRTDKVEVSGTDLNRAIVYCVAAMQQAKATATAR